MTAASELDLPEFDTADTTLHGAAFHQVMAALAEQGWLARTPLGYLVLDREAGEFFLRSRDAVFPGQLLAEMFGVDSGPLREEIDRNLLHLDGNAHRRLRALVGLEDLAKPCPARTIAAVMGADPADADRLADWSQWIQRQFDGPSLLADRTRIEPACTEFYAWCDELLARKRDEPGGDLVSQLIAAEQEGERRSDVELVHLVLNVLIGGVDTTQSQLAHCGCSPTTGTSGPCCGASRSGSRPPWRRCSATSPSRRSPPGSRRPTSSSATSPSRPAPS